MKLKVSQDAAAPAGRVWDGLADFVRIEGLLRDRGIELRRSGGWREAAVGAAWTGRGSFRGRVRRIEAEITGLEPGRRLAVAVRIGGLRIEHEIGLVPVGPEMTRVGAVTDLRPDTLSARLLVQGLKLGRARVLARMEARLAAELRRIGG